MAAGPQTRCTGCGQYISTRPDHDDYAAEERAYHLDRFEEHECSLDWQDNAAWSPRSGERDAYLAALEQELGQVAELEEWAGPVVLEPTGHDDQEDATWIESAPVAASSIATTAMDAASA